MWIETHTFFVQTRLNLWKLSLYKHALKRVYTIKIQKRHLQITFYHFAKTP
jgi:hypothetical protein